MASRALLPTYLEQHDQGLGIHVLITMIGAGIIALLAQVAIPLPFTPVPITGQTLGVLLVSLTFGGRRAPAAVALYLAAGAVGLPVFAAGKAGLTFGPTIGYLVGMLLTSIAVGTLADRGFTRTVPRTYAACLVGSVLTFGCGLAVLSRFVPLDALLTAGFWPFLPGDLIKMTIAVGLVRPMHRFLA